MRRRGEVATVVGIGARAAVLGTTVALVLLAVAAVASAAGVALPDGRAYELVSPAAKNGVEVITQTNKTHITPDANAVTFSALGGFGDLDGTAFDFQYLAKRTGLPGTSGWSSHGINPLGRPVTLQHGELNISTFVNAFTPDLSVGIYKAWRPLVDAPNVREVSNLFRITGLDGGPRTAQIMTNSVNPIPASWSAFADGFFIRTILPQFAGASTDLRHVVFESVLNLTADAPPQDPFCADFGFGCPTSLYENANGQVRLVGRIPDVGQTACDDATGPACVTAPSSQAGIEASNRFYSERMVSADGRRILFQAPGLGIFLREDGVRTERIAASGQLWSASRDGSRAFFISDQSLHVDDTDLTPDVYMYDRDAAPSSRLTLISASRITDGYAETIVDASADGEYLYFVCDGQLIPGEPDAPIMGLYVWHAGQLRFIGTLVGLGEAMLNSPRTVWAGVSATKTSRVSPDGRHLLFMTQSDAGFRGSGGFTGYDHAGFQELYLYSAETGRLACASCNPNRRPATTDARIDVRENETVSQTTSDSSQALTDDGRRVFFNTAESLVPHDLNGRLDPYEYDARTGRVHLLSSGRSTARSYFVEASANGDDVFIIPRERLVGWDVDDVYDLYDARVNGGFPEPPSQAPACTGDACLPAAATAPETANPASSAHRGPGNIRAKLRRHRKCRRGKVLRRTRGRRKCIRRRTHRRAKRADNQNERSGR